MNDLIVDQNGYLLFHARCPNGHLALQRRRAADWKAGLVNERIVFHCDTCDVHWPPPLNDRATILSRLELPSNTPIPALLPSMVRP